MKFTRAFLLLLCFLCYFSTALAQPSQTWKTGQTICYDETGNVIDCAGTGQDGDIQAGVDWPEPRFEDNGDGTITDYLTGLIWLKNAICAGTITWNDALTFCNNLASGTCGLTDGSVAGDWRLPNRKELLSLIDYSRCNPALPQGHLFDNVQSSYYWSATTYANFTSCAWNVNMLFGNVIHYYKSDNHFVWPVRAGQGGSFEPLLISPANGSTVDTAALTFQWSTVTDAASYEILVDNNSGFGSPEINKTGLIETTLTVTNHLPDNLYYWKVRAKFSDGSYTAWSDTWQFTYQLPVYTEPYWVPLYRLFKGDDVYDHYYTTIAAHRDDYVKNNDYTYERIECYISDRKFNDTNCGYLFHLWDKTDDIHFYTGSETEKEAKIIEGFSYEGIVGFIYTQPFDWGVSLYRLFNAANSDYFLTVSEFERDYAINNYGFSADYTTVGYVSPIGILNPNSRLKFNATAGYGAKVGNGNYRYGHIDLRIPGIGMPFVFSRTYNSLNCGTDGPLGHGWTHSFQARLIDDGTRVFVFWPDGHADYYVRDGSNMTEANPGTAENMGCYDTLFYAEPNSDKIYTITRKDQTQYIFKIAESSFDPLGPKAPFDVAQFRTIVDKSGKSISLTYDLATGNLTTITDTANRAVTFTYYGASEGHLGHIKTITDPAGRTLAFTYDSIDNLTKATDARGNTTTFEYDPDGLHLLTKVTLPGGQAITNTYEDFKVKSQTVDGKTFDFSFTDTLATVTAPDTTKPTQYSLSTNQVTSSTDPLDYAASFIFDGANPTRPETINDKNGHDTTFTYDGGSGDIGKKILNKGNVLTAMNALGQKTYFTYDEKNNLLTSKDALNHETAYEYDVNKRNLVKITYPEGGIQSFTYTSNGQVETATDPNGHTTTYTYDSGGNVTRITDHLSNHVDFTYDNVGRMLTRTDQSGRVTTYVYDNNDNLTEVTDANTKTTAYTYDNNNNLIKITNAKGKATNFTYNNMNLFATETDPLAKVYQYGYDDRNNLSSVTDPDGNQTTYTYDADNRLTGITYKGATRVLFTEYDGNGNLKKFKTDLNYETSFAYDDLNRITTCTDPFGKAVSYEYDAAGNRTRVIYPGSKSVTYVYDSDNRLTTVTDWLGGVTTYTYDSAGILQSSLNPNGTKTTYSYDAANRLTGLSNRKSSDTVIAGYTYTLDAAGNHTLVEKDEPIAPEVTAADISYTYDDANRLSAAGGITYTHDNRGNLTGTSAGNTYTFDYADRLTQVAIGGENIVYLYDGLGNRIARTKGGVQTRYILDLNGPMSQVLAETDSSGNVTNYYVYGHGLISRITANGDRYCYHFDSRGSTVGMTDGSENVVNKYAYDEYGSVLNSSEANANPFRYVGKYGVMDEGNGLLFMRARYYDSDTGRFLSKDPLRGELVDPGTLNRYVYVLGNPVMGVDPRGLEGEYDEITIGFGIAVKLGYGEDYEGNAYFTIGFGLGGGFKADSTKNMPSTDLRITNSGEIDFFGLASLGVEHTYDYHGLSTDPIIGLGPMKYNPINGETDLGVGGGRFLLSEKTFRFPTFDKFFRIKCCGEGCSE